MAHDMLKSVRASRGKRMNALVGQAAEEDDLFYSLDLWKEEGSDAESYVEEEEEKPDVFDSDFDESEDEDEEESDEESEKKIQRQMRKEKQQVSIIILFFIK